jgi:hypothetical protein
MPIYTYEHSRNAIQRIVNVVMHCNITPNKGPNNILVKLHILFNHDLVLLHIFRLNGNRTGLATLFVESRHLNVMLFDCI